MTGVERLEGHGHLVMRKARVVRLSDLDRGGIGTSTDNLQPVERCGQVLPLDIGIGALTRHVDRMNEFAQ